MANAENEIDFEAIDAILKREYGQRFCDPARNKPHGRPLLSSERSLGSVVKLLSRSSDYTDEYNTWLGSIPRYILDLVLLLKRVYKPEWGAEWRGHFSVDTINGRPGNELKFLGEKAMTHYLRVGFTPEGGWRTFSLRKGVQCHHGYGEFTADDVVYSLARSGDPKLNPERIRSALRAFFEDPAQNLAEFENTGYIQWTTDLVRMRQKQKSALLRWHT